MKILIAVPCMDNVAAAFAQSLCIMDKIGECRISFVTGSLIYDSRNKLAKQALAEKVDYVMWFDSDMHIPPAAMTTLIKDVQEGRDIVSGLYFRRNPPYTPVLFKKLGLDYPHEDYNDYPENEIFEIEGCGFGCVAMRADILLDMLANEGAMFDPFGGYGEDCAFCMRARKLGYKIFCDSRIKLGHVGHIEITEDLFNSLKGEANA